MFYYKDNSGNAVRGRNKAIKEAFGKYLAFHDSDDVAEAEPKKKTAAKRSGAKPTPAERRAAAAALLRLWRGVARDLALVAAGATESIGFPEDLHELTPVAARCEATVWRDALISIDRALTAVRRNGNPELLLDAIALRWPRA